MENTNDPRVVRTMNLLKKAFFQLMDEDKASTFTVQDVCDNAGISRQTFYQYFLNKDEFVEKFSEDILKGFREEVDVMKVDLSRKVSSLTSHANFINLFKHIKENKSIYEALLMNNPTSPFSIGFKKELSQFIQHGNEIVQLEGATLNAPGEIIERFLAAAYFEVILWWMENNYPYDPEEMAKIILELSIRGSLKD